MFAFCEHSPPHSQEQELLHHEAAPLWISVSSSTRKFRGGHRETYKLNKLSLEHSEIRRCMEEVQVLAPVAGELVCIVYARLRPQFATLPLCQVQAILHCNGLLQHAVKLCILKKDIVAV